MSWKSNSPKIIREREIAKSGPFREVSGFSFSSLTSSPYKFISISQKKPGTFAKENYLQSILTLGRARVKTASRHVMRVMLSWRTSRGLCMHYYKEKTREAGRERLHPPSLYQGQGTSLPARPRVNTSSFPSAFLLYFPFFLPFLLLVISFSFSIIQSHSNISATAVAKCS